MTKKKNYNDWSKEELIEEVDTLRKQKTYGLVWEKDQTKETFDYYINWDGIKSKEHFPEAEGKFPVLKEVQGKEIISEKNGEFNLLIEGDNYHALAVLNFTHERAIDAIYIDPPYNTGNKDFRYNDKWVEKEDGYRHSKWLSFMEKRLKLAKNLLKETGIMFISIDDNEMAQLKILCDEVFGENNFIATYIWASRSGKGATAKHVANLHEYVFCYAKNANKVKLKKDIRIKEGGNFSDDQGEYTREQLRQWGQGDRREDRPTMFYPAIAPDGAKVYPIKENQSEGRWRISKKSMDELIANKDVDFVFDGKKYQLYRKVRAGKITKTAMGTLIFGVGSASTGTIELKQFFKEKVFDTAKPVGLIRYVLELAETSKTATILDFFAGSGTTGQAVLELNKGDGGSRQFILCTNNENNICTEICYPRIEKIVGGFVALDGKKVAGLGSNLKYFKTDFVESASTDRNRKKMVDKSTEMICIKENAFEMIKDGGTDYKIFRNHAINLGIVFNSDAIEDFVKSALKIDGKFNVYVFSLDDTVPESEFKALKGRATLCAIPEAILHVYRRVFKE